MIVFSPGDWIAVIFGSLALLRWGTEFFGKKVEKRSEHVERLEHGLVQLSSDLKVHEREDEIKFGFIQEALGRIERSVVGLQSQMRYVATEHFKDN